MQCVKKNVVSLIRSSDSEAATAVTAWEMPDILSEQDLEPPEPELTEEEKARQEAFEQGYREGLEQGHAEGFQQGHQEGHQAGQAEGLQIAQEEGRQLQQQFQQQADAILSGVVPLIEAMKHPLETQLDETVNHAIATLVVQIARQVVRNELSVNPEHIVDIVKNLFEQLPMTEREVHLHLNPEDKPLLEAAMPLTSGGGFDWSIVEDEQMARGGCHVESRNFSADESVERRLQQSVRQVFGYDVELDPALEEGVDPEAEEAAEMEAIAEEAPVAGAAESTEVQAPVAPNEAEAPQPGEV